MKRASVIPVLTLLGSLLLVGGKSLIEGVAAGHRVNDQSARNSLPWINLDAPREIEISLSEANAAGSVLALSQSLPVMMTSGDFNEDGVPDLVCSYAGAVIVMHLGNVDSIWPDTPEARQRKAVGTSTASPFLKPAQAFVVPETLNFLGVGDFDADGHVDLVGAAAGAGKLFWLAGNGRGGLGRAQIIELPGEVTTLTTGEINRADGLEDIVVGLSGSDGPRLLIYESPEGALRGSPEVISLAAPATALAFGQLDDSYPYDLAVAAGNRLLVMHGRDRRLSQGGARQAEVTTALIEQQFFPFTLGSVAIGDFAGNSRYEIALLSTDGVVHVLAKGAEPGRWGSLLGQSAMNRGGLSALAQSLFGTGITGSQLSRAKVSSRPFDDLIVIDPASHQLQIVLAETIVPTPQSLALRGKAALPTGPIPIDVGGEPVSVLPMRLNADALSDLVILKSGGDVSVVAVTTLPVATLTVNSEARHPDAKRGDGVCASSPATGGVCTLAAAIEEANALFGADLITFSVVRAHPGSAEVQDTVTIDGSAVGRVEITGDDETTGLLEVRATNCVVRKLVVNGVANAGIDVNGNGNIVEGCYVGTNTTGTLLHASGLTDTGIAADGSRNTIGGTTTQARNVVAGMLDHGIEVGALFGAGLDNIVQNNYVGTNTSGTNTLGYPRDDPGEDVGFGIAIDDTLNTVVGGTAISALNLVSGTKANIVIAGSQGALVQGNLLGTDVTGMIALRCAYNSVLGAGVALVEIESDTGTMLPTGHTIGGTVVTARNIIAASQNFGLVIGNGQENLVQGNFIGTDISGTRTMSNGIGVVVGGDSTANNSIGGSVAAARNIIAGNSTGGVSIGINVGGQTQPGYRTIVGGNYIGTQADPTKSLPNGYGVRVNGDNNTIGQTDVGAANIIAFNNGYGISVETGTGNAIRRNSIHSNQGLGIDLGPAGATPNDQGDGDSGANNLQNYPGLTIKPDGTITGLLMSRPSTTYIIEFFSNAACDATGASQGRTFLSSLQVTTSSGGEATFDAPKIDNLTSTATDAAGNTSEFSPCARPANAIELTPRLMLGGVGGLRELVVKDLSNNAIITNDSDVSYSWIKENGLPAALIDIVLDKVKPYLGDVEVKVANIDIAGGRVSLLSKGFNVVQASRRLPDTSVIRSNYAFVIVGELGLSNLDSIELAPYSLISTPGEVVAEKITAALGKDYTVRTPLILFAGEGNVCGGKFIGLLGSTGAIGLKSMKFTLLGGLVPDVELMGAVNGLVGIGAAYVGLGWFGALISTPVAQIGMAQLLDFKPSSETGDNPVADPFITVSNDFFTLPILKGVVQAKKSGVTGVQATLDLESWSLGKATGELLVIVLPDLEKTDIRMERGKAEDPIDLELDGAERQAHAVGMFNAFAQSTQPFSIKFDPLGAKDSELLEKAEKFLPEEWKIREMGVPLQLTWPVGADLQGGLYQGGDNFLRLRVTWQPLQPAIVIDEFRFQGVLPNVVTTWQMAEPAIATVDKDHGKLKGVARGSTSLDLDVCVPFLSRRQDTNPVRVLGDELSCEAIPANDSLVIGQETGVLVNVKAGLVNVSGATVTFLVVHGPNIGKYGEDSTPSALFRYVGNSGEGEDIIGIGARFGSRTAQCEARRTWRKPTAPTCQLSPQGATNAVNTEHSLLAYVSAQGVPMGGAQVSFLINGGPNALTHGTDTTDSGGQAVFSYIGSKGVGTDTIQATASLAGQGFSCNAVTKTWVAATTTRADVSVSKVANPSPVPLGQNLTYSIAVRNNGPDKATGVTLSDTLPGGVAFISASTSQGSCNGTSVVNCSLGDLNNGAMATISILIRPEALGELRNVAYASSPVTDPNARNNTTEVRTAVKAADLALTKGHSPTRVVVGQNLTYTLIASNNGPDDATGVDVTDTLPAGVAFVSATSTRGSCGSGSIVPCSVGILPKGTSATITIVVKALLVGSITNTAIIGGREPDQAPGNNSAADTAIVESAAVLAITKLTPATASQGSTSLEIKIEGVNFVPQTVVSFQPGTGIEIIPPAPPDLGYIGPTELRRMIKVRADAPLGERQVFVSNPDGTSGGLRPFNLFTVTAANADIALTPPSVDFGRVAVGQTVTTNVRISNPGTSQLSIYSITSSIPHFILDLPVIPSNIAAGSAANFALRFTPTAPGAPKATLIVCSNARDKYTVAIEARAEVPGAQPSEGLTTDDGSVELGAAGDGMIMVNRLTPSRYPATLRTIRAFIGQYVGLPTPVGEQVRLIAFAEPTGSGLPPNNPPLLVNQLVTIPAIQPAGDYIEFEVQMPPTINSGDFYVGFQAPNPTNGVVFGADSSGTQQQRAYYSFNDGATYTKLGGLETLVAAEAEQTALVAVNIMVSATVTGVGTCTYAITPNSMSFPGSGGSDTVNITAPAGCRWAASSTASWISINTGSSGIGNGALSYSVTSSTGARLGLVTIAGYSFTVAQAERIVSVSSASYYRTGLAGEAIASAFGTDLANAVVAAAVLPLPTSLAGTTVKVRDLMGSEVFAPLFFVSPQQVNFQMPPGLIPGAVSVTITSGNGVTSAGTSQNDVVAPGLFAANSDGVGVAAAEALRVKSNGSQSYEPIVRYDAAEKRFVSIPLDLGPASDQVYLILYGTGIRYRTSLQATGAVIGGVSTPVAYAGPHGFFVGLDQINLLVPRSLVGRGEIDSMLTVDGRTANTVKINIK